METELFNRKRLPPERESITHKFELSGEVAIYEGYLTVGLYENGEPGEVFLKISKEGSTMSGFPHAWAIAVSMLIQYGVPLRAVIHKFKDMQFEPMGPTKNHEVPYAKSIPDYVARWLELKFLKKE